MDEIIRLANKLKEEMSNLGTGTYLSMSDDDKLIFNKLYDMLDEFLG